MSWDSWREHRKLKKTLSVISGHSSRAIWLLVPFVPVLLLSAREESLSSQDGAHFNSVFWGVVAVLIGAVFIFYQVEKYRSRRFLMFLREHREVLQAGEVSMSGQDLSRMSEVVQYEICVSMFILYAQFRTGYALGNRTSPMRILSTVVVLMFGWWSLPGPVLTIKNLVLNIRGGHRMSVQELLNQLPA